MYYSCPISLSSQGLAFIGNFLGEVAINRRSREKPLSIGITQSYRLQYHHITTTNPLKQRWYKRIMMPNASLPLIAAYYRACYQADYRAVHILNFLSRKVNLPLFLEEADLLTGSLSRVPVDSGWAEQVAAYLDIHSKEKALCAGAFFLTGKSKVMGRNRTVCAPLLVYPVDIELDDQVYYLKADIVNPILNPAVLEVVNRADDGKGVTQEALARHLPTGYLDFDRCAQLETALSELLPNVDSTGVDEFPLLRSGEEMRKAGKNAKADFQIVPAIGLGIVDKGKGARGVLNELEMLAGGVDWSIPLRALFSDQYNRPTSPKSQPIWAPAVLSPAQEEVVQNAHHYPLSVAIGPPGTGKTFTIASLALDLMSKGQSVLIVSRNNQAVKVVAEKIEADLGLPEIVVQATTGNYRKAVKDRLKEWYRGFKLREYRESDVRIARHEVQLRDLRIGNQIKSLQKWEHRIIDWGYFAAADNNGFLADIKKWFIRKRLDRTAPFWQAVLALERLYRERQKLMIEYLRISFFHRLGRVLRTRRTAVRQLIAALSARTGNRQADLFDEVGASVMLQCMPIWLTNTSDIHRMLPAYTEMFDVVIIDEASQCDVASALPVLQRAKRAVLVGDPKQLRHISFVSQRQQQLFREQLDLGHLPRHWLDYRDKSLLDLAVDQIADQRQLRLLNEHFRSLPDIIAFSNRHFYSNELRIMTATPANAGLRNVHLHIVPGQRNAKGDNPEEVAAVIDMIREIVEKEQSLEATICQSIGVLSPFRAQVEALEMAINATFSTEQLLRHRMLIGSPFVFQGEERDVMLLSFAAHPQSPSGVWTYLNREDIFNVSITRARAEQHLFISGPPSAYPDGNMLRAYLDFLAFRREADATSATHEEQTDRFMLEVLDHLNEWNMEQIHINYSIGGVVLDLVVVHQERTIGIDLIGYPGSYSEVLPIEHWKILSRVGISVFTLPYVNWRFQSDRTRLALKKYLHIATS